MTYKTISGDMFDLIAYKEYGNCNYVGELFKANERKLANLKFSAGEEIEVPEVDKKTHLKLPPWKVS